MKALLLLTLVVLFSCNNDGDPGGGKNETLQNVDTIVKYNDETGKLDTTYLKIDSTKNQ